MTLHIVSGPDSYTQFVVHKAPLTAPERPHPGQEVAAAQRIASWEVRQALADEAAGLHWATHVDLMIPCSIRTGGSQEPFTA